MSIAGMSNIIESVDIETRKMNAMNGTNVIDCTKLTVEQANKIEMVLLSLQSRVYDQIIAYEKLAADTSLSQEVRDTMQNNAEWWLKTYDFLFPRKE